MKMTLRNSDELADRLRELARARKRSLNSEIEYRLEVSAGESREEAAGLEDVTWPGKGVGPNKKERI